MVRTRSKAMAAPAVTDDRLQLWREYTPSCWSKRFSDRELLLRHHLDHIDRESKIALLNVEHELDVPYGESEREKLDIFGTDLPDDSPILVFIHGGYWHELSKEQSRYFAKSFHDSGIKTIVIGYDLCPKVTVGDIVKQIERATKFVFNYAEKLNAKKIYYIGHSAGGHLVAKLLSNPNLLDSIPNVNSFQAAFLVSGIYDLTNLIKTSENDYLRLSPDEAKSLSPSHDKYFHLHDRNIRIYIIVAEHESRTFIHQSRIMYDKMMESCQVQNMHFKILDGKDHFDVMEVLSENDNYLKNILLNDSNAN